MEDIVTVKRAIKGDRYAFESLIEKYSDLLYREAYIRCKYNEDTKEIIKETIYKAHKNIYTLNNPQFFKGWISKILINECNDYLNKYGMIDLEHEEGDYVKEIVADHTVEIKVDLYNAIDELENKYKDAIILRYIENLKIEEISNVLDCPINTIKNYLEKGISDMKKLLRNEYENE